MKIFAVSEMMNMSISVKIVKDDGQQIILRGEHCSDYTPALGVNLYEGEQEKLVKWLNGKSEVIE